MGWIDDLPDGCPPDDAQSPSGSVIRLVRNNPPAAEDFVSLADERPGKEWETAELDCQARGLSVFRDRTDAIGVTNRVPALRGRLLAEADLTGAEGAIKQTGQNPRSSHHTWWVPSNSSPEELFAVVESPQ